jgi:hypothetical protein
MTDAGVAVAARLLIAVGLGGLLTVILAGLLVPIGLDDGGCGTAFLPSDAAAEETSATQQRLAEDDSPTSRELLSDMERLSEVIEDGCSAAARKAQRVLLVAAVLPFAILAAGILSRPQADRPDLEP